MTLQALTLIVCSFLSDNCEWKAKNFFEVSQELDIDPALLVSIALYECKLENKRDAIYTDKTGVIARDLCPMGLHVVTNSKELHAGFTYKKIIRKAGEILILYKKYHFNKEKKNNHLWINHYNSGYKICTNGNSKYYADSIIYLSNIMNKVSGNMQLKPTVRAVELGKLLKQGY